jgi:NitT/TauT family transport system permease protein
MSAMDANSEIVPIVVKKSFESRWTQIGLVVLSLGILIALWQLVVTIFQIQPIILPSPTSVAGSLGQSMSFLWPQLWVTIWETLLGFIIAAAVGVLIALGIAGSKIVGQMVYPLLVVSNAIPKIALAPVFIAWFGLGNVPRVVMAVMLAVFPIVISTVVGLVGIDDGLLLFGRSTSANRWRTFRLIRLPAAVPSIFGGLKVGISLALTGAVVGELVAGNSGLGYTIVTAQGNLRTDLAFAAIVILAVIGVVLFYLIDLLGRLVGRGHRE